MIEYIPNAFDIRIDSDNVAVPDTIEIEAYREHYDENGNRATDTDVTVASMVIPAEGFPAADKWYSTASVEEMDAVNALPDHVKQAWYDVLAEARMLTNGE
jgi:hypothetical protein